jgi:hypothetical protein
MLVENLIVAQLREEILLLLNPNDHNRLHKNLTLSQINPISTPTPYSIKIRCNILPSALWVSKVAYCVYKVTSEGIHIAMPSYPEAKSHTAFCCGGAVPPPS